MRSATDGMSNRNQAGVRTSVAPATRPSTVCDGFPIKRITFDLPSLENYLGQPGKSAISNSPCTWQL